MGSHAHVLRVISSKETCICVFLRERATAVPFHGVLYKLYIQRGARLVGRHIAISKSPMDSSRRFSGTKLVRRVRRADRREFGFHRVRRGKHVLRRRVPAASPAATGSDGNAAHHAGLDIYSRLRGALGHRVGLQVHEHDRRPTRHACGLWERAPAELAGVLRRHGGTGSFHHAVAIHDHESNQLRVLGLPVRHQ